MTSTTLETSTKSRIHDFLSKVEHVKGWREMKHNYSPSANLQVPKIGRLAQRMSWQATKTNSKWMLPRKHCYLRNFQVVAASSLLLILSTSCSGKAVLCPLLTRPQSSNNSWSLRRLLLLHNGLIISIYSVSMSKPAGMHGKDCGGIGTISRAHLLEFVDCWAIWKSKRSCRDDMKESLLAWRNVSRLVRVIYWIDWFIRSLVHSSSTSWQPIAGMPSQMLGFNRISKF